MSGEYAWKKVLDFKNGHRFFVATTGAHESRIAVADRSGKYPHTTEDDVLWIDHTRAVKISDHASVPVLDLEGKEFRIGMYVEDALTVADEFGLEVEAGERELRIARMLVGGRA